MRVTIVFGFALDWRKSGASNAKPRQKRINFQKSSKNRSITKEGISKTTAIPQSQSNVVFERRSFANIQASYAKLNHIVCFL